MATDSVVCPECASDVPNGRLTCGECGTLLALVPGARARPVARVALAEADASEVVEPKPEFEPANEPGREPPPEPEFEPEPEPGLEPPAEPAIEPAPEPDEPPEPDDEPERGLGESPEVGSTVGSALAMPPPVPGSYLPPSASFGVGRFASPATASPAGGVTSPSPAAPPAWPSRPASAGWAPGTAEPAPDPGDAVGRRSFLAEVALEAPNDLVGWLLALGALGSIVAFVLPWASSGGGVIGADQLARGYFDRWGLANPANLLLVLVGAGTLALTLVPNRLALWIRQGVVPLIVGGLELGLGFAYGSGPFGGGIGLAVLSLAAVLLVAGGVLAVRPGRHVPGSPGV